MQLTDKEIFEHEDSLNIAGIVLISTFLTSLINNFMVLMVFIRNHTLRKTINFFTITMTCFNMIRTLIHMPLIIGSTYYRGVLFGELGCKIQGGLFIFTSTLSLVLIMTVSLSRYLIIQRPFELHLWTFKLCGKILLMSLGLCGFWSFLPAMGWSKYSAEVNKIYCSHEFNTRNLNIMSFNIISMILYWLIPLIVIFYTNLNLYLKLKRKTKQLKNLYVGVDEPRLEKLHSRRRNQLTILILITVGFLLSWTPYVIIETYALFNDITNIKYEYKIVPLVATTTTTVWCPILEMIFNTSVRKNLLFVQNPIKDQVIQLKEIKNNNRKEARINNQTDFNENGFHLIRGDRYMDARLYNIYDMDQDMLKYWGILCPY